MLQARGINLGMRPTVRFQRSRPAAGIVRPRRRADRPRLRWLVRDAAAADMGRKSYQLYRTTVLQIACEAISRMPSGTSAGRQALAPGAIRHKTETGGRHEGRSTEIRAEAIDGGDRQCRR